MSDLDEFKAAPLPPSLVFGDADPARFSHALEAQGLGLWECWLTIRKRLVLVLCLIAGALTFALIAIVMQKPRYTATATLLIQPETPQVLDVTQLVTTTQSNDEHDFYRTQEDLLQSPALAAKVIRALALDQTALLEPPRRTGLVRLADEWPSRLLAALRSDTPAPPADT